MKQAETKNRLRGLALSDLQKEIFDLERKIQQERFLLSLGKTKHVRLIRQLKSQLALSLTVAKEKLIEPKGNV